MNCPTDISTGQYMEVIAQVRFAFPRYFMLTSKDSDDVLIRLKFDPLSLILHKNSMGRK